jgi:hypothetical protein
MKIEKKRKDKNNDHTLNRKNLKPLTKKLENLIDLRLQ